MRQLLRSREHAGHTKQREQNTNTMRIRHERVTNKTRAVAILIMRTSLFCFGGYSDDADTADSAATDSGTVIPLR